MKNSYLIIICLFLLTGQMAWGESVTKTVHFSHSELKCDTITGGDGQVYNILSYPGIVKEDNIGCPTLPVKYVSISLPYTADDITLSVKQSNVTSHVLNNKVFPVQEPETTFLGKVERKFIPCNRFIYESSSFYPLKPARISEISCAGHGDRHVVVAIYPAVYSPTENRYDFYEDIELTISYNHSPQRAQNLTRSSQTVDIGIPYYKYCIITNQRLEKSFARLLAWTREKGLNAGVVRIEDILNNIHLQSGDTVSGINDNAGKLRQYLQYAYKYGNTEYVLMGGNDTIVPTRYGWGYDGKVSIRIKLGIGISEDYHVPTDFYYSELNTNWEQNGDIYYGEDTGIWDYGSELCVGRLLCSTHEEIENYTNKLLRYELNPGNGSRGYLQKAFYSQSDQMQDEGHANSVANDIMDLFPDTAFVSEITSGQDSVPSYPTGNDVIERMNEHYGYLNWFHHGHPNAMTVKSDGYMNNDSIHHYAITSVVGNIPWEEPETANGLNCLNNKDYPSIAYSIACTITPFEYNNIEEQYSHYPSIGKSFTLGKDYGGPALIGNTRVGLTDYTYLIQRIFNIYMRNNTISESLNIAKFNYNNERKHHNAFTINVIGCPDIYIWTSLPKLFNASLSYNSNGGIITSNSGTDTTYVCIRHIGQNIESSEKWPLYPYNGYTNIPLNSLITLTGRNYLPQIMPLTIQNDTLQGTHHLIVKDVTCGKDVRSGTQGNVIFDQGSDYTFETQGSFKLTKGVTIKQGAKLKVMPSEINY